MPKQVKVNALSYAQLIKLMFEGAYNCQELAQQTGLHYVTVLQYARELYAAKAAHICAWDKDPRGRDMIKVYKLGPGKDVKRERMTGAERQRRARAKQKVLETSRILSFNTQLENRNEQAITR